MKQMISYTIELHNKQYPVREVTLPEFGKVSVSIVELNDALINENGGYVSDETMAIDEKIFYFVEKHEIEFSDDDLIQLLVEQAL